MPRGSNDGSIIRKPAVGGRQSGCIILRKRYTDAKGRSREKKRIAHTDAEALRMRRDIQHEIEAELAGISSSQSQEFDNLVESCRTDEGNPVHFVAAMLLKLEDALRRNTHLLPEFQNVNVDLRFFCNMQHFNPTAYTAAVLDLFEQGLKRLGQFSGLPLYTDVDDIDEE